MRFLFCSLLINNTVYIHSTQAPVLYREVEFFKGLGHFGVTIRFNDSIVKLIPRPGSAEIFILVSPDLAMIDRLWSLENSYIHLEPDSFTF